MTISIDDRHLVESYQAGDSHAFADLVEAYGPSLMGHALRRLGDRAAAEDAVQETFVRAYRALARFDGDYRVGPWLHRILANVCNDEGNRRRREAEKFDRFAADPFAVELAPGVEDELGLDLDDTNLTSALQALPANYREALNLRFVQDLSYDEVAKVAGVSEQNARARVSRARSAARAALKGVAAIPLLLLPALRRTETMAAAAGPSEAVRVATDAAAAAAPAATPIVTKAVVGISLVAALAAPSSVQNIESQARGFGSAAPAVVADTAPSVTEASEPVVEVPLTSASAAEAPVVADTAPEPDPGPAAPEATTSGPVALPASPGSVDQGDQPETPPVAGVDDTPAPEAPAATGGSLALSELTFTPAGPRFDVAGAANLVLGERTLAGTVSGRIAHTDQEGVRRLTLELRLTLDDGSAVDLRIQARGTPSAGQEGVERAEELAEVDVFELSGPFRATAPAAVGLIEAGNATGTLDYATGTLSLTLG